MDFSKFYEELQKENPNFVQMDEGYAEIMNDEMFQDCPVWVNNLFTCMKGYEMQINQICDASTKLTSFIDKAEGVMASLMESASDMRTSLDSMSSRCDQLCDQNKELCDKVEELEGEIKRMSIVQLENKMLKREIEEVTQNSQQCSLVFHGVEEKEDEDTDKVVRDVIYEMLSIYVAESDVYDAQRLGNKRGKARKPRPIIAKFCRQDLRRKVYGAKRCLKGSNLLITEYLTKKRLQILRAAKKTYGKRNAWTFDGKVFAEDNGYVKEMTLDE